MEIVVIDNGSSDHTFELLKAYEGVRNFSYEKNDPTIDVSKNIFKLIARCRGVYFWCYGDDDLVPRGTIRDIVLLLDETSPNHLVMDRQDFHTTDEIDLRDTPTETVDYRINDIQARFDRFDSLFSFITSNIYLRQNILRSFQERGAFLDNNYTNKYAAWMAARAGGVVFIEGRIAYKRCSIGQGSHFNENLDLRVKTFIFDQVKVAKAIEKTDRELASLALEKYLSVYRSFAKYKVAGADIRAIIKELKALGVPDRFLRSLRLISYAPVLLLRGAIAYKAFWRGLKAKASHSISHD